MRKAIRPKRTMPAVNEAFHKLRKLEDGWLDGIGQAPSKEGLKWLWKQYCEHYPNEMPRPYIYPTPEGGVQIEWQIEGQAPSLEIDLINKSGQYFNLDLASDEFEEMVVDLSEVDGWNQVYSKVLALVKA